MLNLKLKGTKPLNLHLLLCGAYTIELGIMSTARPLGAMVASITLPTWMLITITPSAWLCRPAARLIGRMVLSYALSDRHA